MNDYCNGIAYATGYVMEDSGKRYLIVRNTDPWYVNCISDATGHRAYKSGYNERLGKTEQWVVKTKITDSLPTLYEIQSISDFCRAYIEIHGILDLSKRKNGKKKLRLRIYGKESIIQFINMVLPAKEKKIQYVSNKIEGKYIGKTCVLYFQSQKEIEDILKFIDGYPKNKRVWSEWNIVIKKGYD